ncbi:unnamed protein product [Closterium sp. NIES-53]
MSRLTSRFPFTLSSPTALPLSPPPPLLFLALGPSPVDPLPPQGSAPLGVSQLDPLPLGEPVKVTLDSGASWGGADRGAASGGVEPAGVEEPGGAETGGAESGGAEPRGTASVGGPVGASPRQSRRQEPLSLRQLRNVIICPLLLAYHCFSRPSSTSLPVSRAVMEVARTSMIHAAAPHFLWLFAVRYAAHRLIFWSRVSLPETSPTLRWTGKGGDASVFQVWGSRAFVRDTSANKLSARAIHCVFLGFPLDAPGWQFYHPTSSHVFPSQDVTFDESVSFYRLFPYRSAPPPPPPLFLAPGPPPLDPLPPQGPAPSGVSQVDPLPGTVPVEVADGSGAAQGLGVLSVGVLSLGVRSLGVLSLRVRSLGVLSLRVRSLRVLSLGVLLLLEVRQRTRLRSGAAGAGFSATGETGAGGVRVTAGAGGTRAVAAASPGGARTRGTGAGGTGIVEGAGAGGAGAGDPGARGAGAGDPGAGAASAGGAGAGGTGAGGTVQGRLFFVPPPPSSLPPPGSVLRQDLNSPLPAPSPYAEQTDSLTERREPESRPALPVRAVRTGPRVPRPHPPPVPGTHIVALRPSSVPLRVPLPSPPASSLADRPDLVRTTSPTVTRLLATVGTDPLFESAVASALVAELVDFAAVCRLDYATSLVPEVKQPPGSPPVFKAHYIARGFSQQQGVDFFQTFSPTLKMTTLWVLLHVAAQRTQWSLRRPVYGPCEWHDTLRTTFVTLGFARSNAGTSLFLRTDTSLPLFYILVYVDDLVFATADTEALALVKSELQKRYTCTDLGELHSYFGLQVTRDRARRTITLTQSHMVHQVLQCFGFQFSSPQPTPLSTGHFHSAPPSDESVEPSSPYPGLVGCLMYLMTCTRPDLAYPLSILARYVTPERHRPEQWEAAKRVLRYLCSTSGMGLVVGGRCPLVLTGHANASWVDDLATQRSSQGYTFSLGSDSVSWRSNRSSYVISSDCEAEIYAGAMAAQELRWLTYLQADLGERPRSPLQCGQLRLAYVAIRANTADIFTKALQPGDHQRFSTVLGLIPTLPHLLTA